MVRAFRRGLISVAMIFAAAGQSQAGLLWYNGDPDLMGISSNEINTSNFDTLLYDDFNVTSAVTVTEIFSDNLMNFSTSTAYWEIRSGVSAGVGGTLVASGTSAATQSLSGFVPPFAAPGYFGYTIDVSGLSVALAPGTYWLTVAPIGTGTGRSFIQTTNGANAVGTPTGTNGNAFYTNFLESFKDTTFYLGQDFSDFSMGVIVNTAAVPEPGTLTLIGLGAFGLVANAIRRRRQQSA